MRMRVLMWLAVLGHLLTYLSSARVVDLDVFHSMSLFREALSSGELPREDVFAYTPTLDPVVHHEWGTGAILYGIWQGAGLGADGLAALRYVLVVVVAGLSYACARRRGAHDASIAAVALVAAPLVTIGFFSPVRAQAFTLLFTATLLLLLEIDRTGRRWWIPVWVVAHLVWLNVHGGFVVGIALVGATAAERFAAACFAGERPASALRSVAHLIGLVLVLAALVLVNPYGPEYVTYLWRAIWMERPAIPEWAPLWDSRVNRLFLWVYLFSFAVVLLAWRAAGTRAARQVGGWSALLATSAAAAFSVRHLSLYALAWFTFVAPLVTRTELGRVAAHWWIVRRAVVAAVLLAMVAMAAQRTVAHRSWSLVIPDRPGRDDPKRWYPVRAANYLAEAGFRGRLFTCFRDGAYITWRLHPAVKVSFDSRYEAAYAPGMFEKHARVFDALPGWEHVIEQYPPDAILVPHQSPLDAALERRPDEWARVYRDDADSIYVRPPAVAHLHQVGRDL